MTKAVPSHFPSRGGNRYIRPTRAAPGTKPKRGELARPFAPRQKSLQEMGVTYNEDGTVTVPTSRKGKREFRKVASPIAAIRMVREQIETIKMENTRISEIHRQATQLQHDMLSRWNSASASEREFFTNLLVTYAGAMGNIKQLSRVNKVNAKKGLERAVELLRAGNVSAGAVKIVGIANELVAQINAFTGQRAHLPNRGNEIYRTAMLHQERLERYVTENLSRLDAMRSASLTKEKIEHVLVGMRRDYVSMQNKIEKELRGPVLVEFGEAGKALKAGNTMAARTHLRNANRLIIQAMSRRYILSIDFLRIVQNSSVPAHRKETFTQQLRMLASHANFEYHLAEKNRRLANWQNHLAVFVEASRRDLPKTVISLVKEAAAAVRAKMPALMNEKMEAAVEAIRNE